MKESHRLGNGNCDDVIMLSINERDYKKRMDGAYGTFGNWQICMPFIKIDDGPENNW